MEQVILTLFSGAAVALITAFVTLSTADKKNAVENITQERKKWRDDLRAATIALRRYFENKNRAYFNKELATKSVGKIIFYSAAEAKAFFEIRLNLGDPEDEKLLAILDRLVTHDCASRKPSIQKWEPGEDANKDSDFKTKDLVVEDLLAYFEEGMSYNLKHDWERAKKEVRGNNWLIRFLLVIVVVLLVFGFGFVSCNDNVPDSKKNLKQNVSAVECISCNENEIDNPPIPYKMSLPQVKCVKVYLITEQNVEVSDGFSKNDRWSSFGEKIFLCAVACFILVLFNKMVEFLENLTYEKMKESESKWIKCYVKYPIRKKLRRYDEKDCE